MFEYFRETVAFPLQRWYHLIMHYVNAKSILSADNGMNIYRGCTHGCIYCDSRSSCYHMNHEFTDVEVKSNAPSLLEEALRRKRRRCMVGTGSMSDPYCRIEETELIMRRCLEVIARCGCGVTVLTKSSLILRDRELYAAINERCKSVVQMTLTTYSEDLCRVIEPHVASSAERFAVLCEMKKLGIPTVVWLCPILPYINDNEENLRGLLAYCFEAGVKGIICFGMGVTLREGDREYFYDRLDEHFPGVKKKYMARYGSSYSCESENSQRLMSIFNEECARRGVMTDNDEIFAYLHRYEDRGGGEQLSLI